ncbi:MAG: caspase family protein [Sulfuritalea sp.]|nr:caspase family protein [Sulfuritalea sp.]
MKSLLSLLALLCSLPALAQMRPPSFMGGIPGLAQSRALDMQRHQARTLLYREALEELKRNPAAADVPECGAEPSKALCLAKPAEAPTETGGGRRLALLVANMAYPLPIPALDTPGADVAKIGEVLRRRFGFEVRLLHDAGKAATVEALNRMAREAKAEDSVLLFYAGHGYLLDDTKMGYWIPIDASVKTAAGWISNNDISKLLKAIPARQLMLVSDSCFSGSLTREQKVGAHGTADEILKRRSVVVFSSGGEEPVSDEGHEGHSIFAWNLIKTLEGLGGVAPGVEVWRTVHGRVTREFPQQPQYGAVLSAGHSEGGDWLFRQP